MTRDDAIRMAQEAWLIIKAAPPTKTTGDCLERFANLVIADFLERTGQYVTNDASREAALAQARAEEREANLAEIETGIWVDMSTEEVLDAIATSIRNRGNKENKQ